MKRWVLSIVWLLALVAARAESQPRLPAALDQAVIRVQGQGAELIVLRRAPVTYSTLEQMYAGIGGPRTTSTPPVRVVRVSPLEHIDYLFCVTSGWTLVVGERVYGSSAGERRLVFVRGEVVRSYPSLHAPEGWLWIVQVPLSREATVTLELRAPVAWPLEAVAVTANGMP